ncbi:PmoA family protein [Rhodopirellula bahusiensis]|uniref:DUF6807 domain-containing protein n=6 Tax=Rhodopirellula bahusiensis TaxID=2014065 RepID=UPI003263C6B0
MTPHGPTLMNPQRFRRFLHQLTQHACVAVAAVSFTQTASAAPPSAATAEATATWETKTVASDDRESKQQDVEIYRGGKLIARHHSSLLGTPGLYPLHSPSGLPLTRDYPMEEKGKYEKDDHHHHRSLWFTHGIVNELDFWLDKPTPHTGYVVQTSMSKEEGEDGITLTTNNDWNDPDGNRVLSDQRQWTFSESQGDTVIDLDVRLKATDGDVTFGDTKEGTLGIRVAGSIKVDAKLGGTGQNAEGLKDGAAWGKKSAWVDYSGPIQQAGSDEPSDWPTAGITMFYHPGNSQPDCYWHVRTYGLFAANPFGRHHFGQPEYEGVKIADGEHLDLHFRIVLHDGGFDREKSEQHFADYADTKPSL